MQLLAVRLRPRIVQTCFNTIFRQPPQRYNSKASKDTARQIEELKLQLKSAHVAIEAYKNKQIHNETEKEREAAILNRDLTQKLELAERRLAKAGQVNLISYIPFPERKEELAQHTKECQVEQDVKLILRLLRPLEISEEPYAIRNPDLLLGQWTLRLKGEYDKSYDVSRVEASLKSLSRHARVAEDPDILPIYSDGSQFGSDLSAAAVAPSIPYAKLQRIATPPDVRYTSSNVAELEGITLALEIAQDIARPQQRIVIFTDSLNHAKENASRCWLEDPRRENGALTRAAKALTGLEGKGVGVSITWLAKECEVVGNRFAHRLGRIAKDLAESETFTLSNAYWTKRAQAEALKAARHHAFVSDVG